MVVTRSGFTQVVANAFAGLGFSAECPSVYEFPMPMFVAGSDLSPLRENIDKIVYGLTKWEPKIKTKGLYRPEMVTVQGKDYQEALDTMNKLFLKNNWGDGLPIVPATEERVKWILTGTDLPRDTVIAEAVAPRGGIATVESIAVALTMAGGRPEYMPVLIASVQAITDPAWGLPGANSTTGGPFPTVIVNGPVSKQIRLASGYGVMGPDPVHPSAGPIGRAIRIILQDLGGALPGTGTMALYGTMRFTNAVFAEDEEGLPPGWKLLSVERGFPKDANVVTVLPGRGGNTVPNGGTAKTAQQAAEWELMGIARLMSAAPRAEKADSPNYALGVALIGRGLASQLADAGYSKEKVKTFLWSNSKVPWAQLVARGLGDEAKAAGTPEGQDMPLVARPDQVMLVVSGGAQAGHTYWMWAGGGGARAVVSKEVKLPAKANWDALLKQAEAELGPIPAQ
jgi:hypothetical protein